MYVEQSRLPNGVTVVTTPMPYLHSVTVVYYLRVGSRFETPHEAGICHFIEHMLFKGTRHFPTAREVSEAVENLGGDFNGGTGKELTDYSVKIGSDHLERALDALTDLVRAPLFAAKEIEKERRVISEELRMYKDAPQEWVQVLLDEILFPGTALGREVVGTPETLQSLSRAQMLAFMAAHYIPANLVVSVAGNVMHDQVVAALTARLGDWPAASPRPWLPVSIASDGPRASIDARPTEQVSLCLAVPALGHDDPARDALTLLNALLGDGMSSRLFLSIREDQGLAYDIGSSVTSFYETGTFEIAAGCDPDRVDAVLSAVLTELRRLCDAPPSTTELQRIKDYTRGRFVIGLEDTASMAGWLGGQMALRGEIRSVEDILARLEAVTPDDVQTLAQRLFRTDALRMAAIGPLPPADHFLPLLRV
jgi:predicted Zn-dependent peptidase